MERLMYFHKSSSRVNNLVKCSLFSGESGNMSLSVIFRSARPRQVLIYWVHSIYLCTALFLVKSVRAKLLY